MTTTRRSITILGAGHIGFAMALLLSRSGDYDVLVADRDVARLDAVDVLGVATLATPDDAALQTAVSGRYAVLNALCKLYLVIIRGTPTMVQLLIIYYVIFAAADVSKVLVAIVAFGINSSAYLAEVVRSGIMSIDRGQSEAGRSLGLSYGQTLRLIILPQAFKNVLPAIGNELITLLKEKARSNKRAMDTVE